MIELPKTKIFPYKFWKFEAMNSSVLGFCLTIAVHLIYLATLIYIFPLTPSFTAQKNTEMSMSILVFMAICLLA